MPNHGIFTSFEPFWTVPDSFLEYNFGSIPPELVREPTRGTDKARRGSWGNEITQKEA